MRTTLLREPCTLAEEFEFIFHFEYPLFSLSDVLIPEANYAGVQSGDSHLPGALALQS